MKNGTQHCKNTLLHHKSFFDTLTGDKSTKQKLKIGKVIKHYNC